MEEKRLAAERAAEDERRKAAEVGRRSGAGFAGVGPPAFAPPVSVNPAWAGRLSPFQDLPPTVMSVSNPPVHAFLLIMLSLNILVL